MKTYNSCVNCLGPVTSGMAVQDGNGYFYCSQSCLNVFARRVFRLPHGWVGMIIPGGLGLVTKKKEDPQAHRDLSFLERLVARLQRDGLEEACIAQVCLEEKVPRQFIRVYHFLQTGGYNEVS